MAMVRASLARSRQMALDASTRAVMSRMFSADVGPAVSSNPFVTVSPVENVANKQTYDNAIKALNNLQSNYSVLQNSVNRMHSSEAIHIAETKKFLARIGITLDRLDTLPVIHIAGSKGKGSTCSLVESILRAHGYRTGFFSSPHLVMVTERLRLNGVPIAREKFTKHFWNIYDQLQDAKDHGNDLPSYFNFLTVLALQVFLEERVDVAIIEVGIGGRYDCTNVVRNTKTVGITSLGLEHTRLLGNTLEAIAWQKAGIIKPSSDVFTSVQPEPCLTVIQAQCKQEKASLTVAPAYESYKWDRIPKLTPDTPTTRINTSLAIQIARNWIKRTQPGLLEAKGDVTHLPETFTSGIESCFWPGRMQQIKTGSRTIYLDGAHTAESMDVCMHWFITSAGGKHPKLLLFNTTGDREAKKLLEIIARSVKFDAAFFVPNVAFSVASGIVDSTNFNFPIDEQVRRCQENGRLWSKLQTSSVFVHSSIESVLQQIENTYTNTEPCDILVTGSIHLIGAVMTALTVPVT